MTSSFTSGYNRGFHMTFENGITVSVQWGKGNYCERRNKRGHITDDLKEPITTSPDAEIAIWDADNNWLDFGAPTGGDVKGWVKPQEVAEWIYLASNAKSLSELQSTVLSIS